jgi:hypothetical protein
MSEAVETRAQHERFAQCHLTPTISGALKDQTSFDAIPKRAQQMSPKMREKRGIPPKMPVFYVVVRSYLGSV